MIVVVACLERPKETVDELLLRYFIVGFMMSSLEVQLGNDRTRC